jgi:hypothetical protein
MVLDFSVLCTSQHCQKTKEKLKVKIHILTSIVRVVELWVALLGCCRAYGNTRRE